MATPAQPPFPPRSNRLQPDDDTSFAFEEQEPVAPPPSAARAFFYAVFCPGWGEYYAGSKQRGAITLSLFLLVMSWFFWLFYTLLNVLLSMQPVDKNLLYQMGVSLFGLVALWSWGVFSALDVVHSERQFSDDPLRHHAGWAVVFSWVCPGSGHAYQGRRWFGLGLMSVYLLSTVLIVPMFLMLLELGKTMFANVDIYQNPTTALELVKEWSMRMQNAFAARLLEFLKLCAMLMAALPLCDAWRRDFEEHSLHLAPLSAEDRRMTLAGMSFFQRTEWRLITLFALNWVCPGVSQLMQGRPSVGWAVFSLYVGATALVSALFGNDFITVAQAKLLGWIPTLTYLGAMVEAPYWAWRRQQFIFSSHAP